MAATIEVKGATATLDATLERGWFWVSTSSWLQDYLNGQLPEDGPNGWDPDPDYHEAKRMAKLLDGRITESKDLTPEFVSGRIY